MATLVEDLDIASYLSRRLLAMLEDYNSTTSKSPSMMIDEILTEHLKVVFNVSLFYPRTLEDRKSNGNETLSPPNGASGRHIGKGKGKATSTSTSMSKSISSSSSSSSKSGSRSSSPAEGTTGRTSPNKGSNSINANISTTPINERAKSPSNSKTATEKIKGYFSRKTKDTEKITSMYHDDADVLRPWGFER